MDTIVLTIVSVTVIGALCAVILSVASKIMSVKGNALVANLRELMPGANCGACGFAQCEEYATAIAEGGAAANKCVLGGDELAKAISELMGSGPVESVIKLVAVVHCIGDTVTKSFKMEYAGIHTCVAEKMLFGGQNACTFGCLGYGDCVAACPSNAICMENGLARVDPRRCSGCGLCAKICPNKIITVQDAAVAIAVKCMNTEKGAIALRKCSVGCVGCMRCAKTCHAKAITVSHNVASIDYSICTSCGDCLAVCARGCLIALT